MFDVSEAWKVTYPEAVVGALALHGVANPERSAALDARKSEFEAALRKRWAGSDRKALAALPTIQAYSAYYAQFHKTYHVLPQLESIALKGRSLPSKAALVEAMFIAELDHQLLTAGHDVATLILPVTVDIARGDESYITMGGKEQMLALGDMYMRDGAGVISSVIYGPDQRTAITPATERVLFTVYAPPGIGRKRMEDHIAELLANVFLVCPAAVIDGATIYEARGAN